MVLLIALHKFHSQQEVQSEKLFWTEQNLTVLISSKVCEFYFSDSLPTSIWWMPTFHDLQKLKIESTWSPGWTYKTGMVILALADMPLRIFKLHLVWNIQTKRLLIYFTCEKKYLRKNIIHKFEWNFQLHSDELLQTPLDHGASPNILIWKFEKLQNLWKLWKY